MFFLKHSFAPWNIGHPMIIIRVQELRNESDLQLIQLGAWYLASSTHQEFCEQESVVQCIHRLMKMSTDDIISGFFRDKILISSENRSRALKINEYGIELHWKCKWIRFTVHGCVWLHRGISLFLLSLWFLFIHKCRSWLQFLHSSSPMWRMRQKMLQHHELYSMVLTWTR